MAWAGRSPAAADSQHLIVKSCWKVSNPENVTLCSSSSTVFPWCSEVSWSPTFGVGLHTGVIADVISNTVTSSLSQRFRKDRNSSFYLKHVFVVRKLQQTWNFFHCGSKLWTLGWWEGGDVWGGAQSFTCIPQQGTRREFYCSALTEFGSNLCWTKTSKQWFSLTK